MVEHKTLESFGRGDFVYWKMSDGTEDVSYGIVSAAEREFVDIVHFEDGFPDKKCISLQQNFIERIPMDEALNHFDQIYSKLNERIETGGLLGAVSARKQHYLSGIISLIKKGGGKQALNTPIKEPGTGFYVLSGIYSDDLGNGLVEGEGLEGLVVNPRLSENLVSELTLSLRPIGFGKISSEVYNVDLDYNVPLNRYRTYEVPDKARDLVRNEHIMDINCTLPQRLK